MNATSTTTEPADHAWATGDIEPALADLRTLTSLLGHLAASAYEVTPDHLHYIEDRLTELHERLDSVWHRAWDQQKAERATHAAALAAAEARRAAPGSAADVAAAEALWSLVRAWGSIATEAADKRLAPAAALAAAGEGQP
jgi:hypothetical protein